MECKQEKLLVWKVPANIKGELEHALDHCTVCASAAYLQAQTVVYVCVLELLKSEMIKASS